MPLYEYDCPGCGDSFEKLVRSMSKADAVTCPTCGSENVSRKFSTFAVKGTVTRSSATSSTSSAASCAPGGL